MRSYPVVVLSDLLVVELASVLAGPSVGQFFAELGATVIKVENPRTKGDVTRRWTAPNREADETDDRSAYFCCCNHGKQSVAIDLSTQTGRDLMHRLASGADMVLSSFRPGTAEQLGADADTLRRLNPELIVGQITGYGDNDPRPGYDAVIQSEAGFTYMNGQPDGPPTKLPVALMDVLAAHQLKEGLLVKLIERMQTGHGGVVTVSLLQAAVSALVNQATNYLVAGHVPERMGSAHPNIVPYGTLYPTAGGDRIVLAVGTDRQFRSLCEILGLDDVAKNPKYATNAARVENRNSLDELLRPRLAEMKTERVLADLEEANVPAGQVRSMPQVFEQESAREMTIAPDGHPAGLRQVAFPTRETAGPLSPPPHYAEHTQSVLHDRLGLSHDDLATLADDQVIDVHSSG
ncbi:carnitine dehydratase [Longibacter salinarum]|uniref:Carnitine dehydratase n=1 Tax=Longibacter salinarum TaxID=1850348 RepID=A0A2A8CT80_9BACT|nr:CaiB/BaiF CoA-transferase family protein [Longibacter salinarum]PEN10397.1 carnitine dehydratase [Longibacter salinarum]